jgi:hypothetical protein
MCRTVGRQRNKPEALPDECAGLLADNMINQPQRESMLHCGASALPLNYLWGKNEK